MTQSVRDKYWQERWEEAGVFTWRNNASLPSYYVLEMFPYTSGRMHLGHARNYSMGDAIARMQRARGFNVLYPMGWDAFGLPAETAAIKNGTDPAEFTAASISSMKAAMRSLGLSYSWQNEITTCAPNYIAAQQRLFIELFKAGLIFRDTSFVYWCICANTVLAAEQAAGGVCWRCGQPVTKRRETQWFLNIRAYADRLVDDLERLQHWPAAVVNIQRSWIGRNYGMEVDFLVEGTDTILTVFTTRADTLGGCTFLALAPEHRLLDELPIDAEHRSEALAYRDKILIQTTLDRANAPKSGVNLGLNAINPLTGDRIPIYIANYVLSDYGTGAVMAVPAHDERDFEFAVTEGLPIRRVVAQSISEADLPLQEVFTKEGGVIVNSGPLNGASPAQARDCLLELPKTKSAVRRATSYRLQNWSISRQRFWGNPIPIVHCPTCGAVPASETELPILLPESMPQDGEGSPLSRVPEFYKTTCPCCGRPARRDTDTMDTFVDSSWYYLRFPTPAAEEPFDPEIVNRLMPVDVYIGGMEHATLHLIYARFMTKVLKDLGRINFDEPFATLYNQGMVNDAQGRKQSKSLGNIVEPANVIHDHGADALRVYLLFKTMHNAPIDWEPAGLRSTGKYLERARRLVERFAQALEKSKADTPATADCRTDEQKELCRRTHETIDRVTRDVIIFQFNTAIAALMELTNTLYQYEATDEDIVAAGAVRTLIRLLNPFAPHITEEMWHDAGGETLLATLPWPVYDPRAVELETMTLAIQINGKFVAEATFPKSIGREALVAKVSTREDVQRRLTGSVIKDIYVPGAIINLVVSKN